MPRNDEELVSPNPETAIATPQTPRVNHKGGKQVQAELEALRKSKAELEKQRRDLERENHRQLSELGKLRSKPKGRRLSLAERIVRDRELATKTAQAYNTDYRLAQQRAAERPTSKRSGVPIKATVTPRKAVAEALEGLPKTEGDNA